MALSRHCQYLSGIILLVATGLFSAGCGGSSGASGGSEVDSSSDEGSEDVETEGDTPQDAPPLLIACTQAEPVCATECGGAASLLQAQCEEGFWGCPEGAFLADECPSSTCWGAPNVGEICGATGFECAPAEQGVLANCPAFDTEVCRTCQSPEGFFGEMSEGGCTCRCDQGRVLCGPTAGVDECAADADCELVQSCCGCDAKPLGRAGNDDGCTADCDTDQCALLGVGQARCLLGRCVAGPVKCEGGQCGNPATCAPGQLPAVNKTDGCWSSSCVSAASCEGVPNCSACGALDICMTSQSGAITLCIPRPDACGPPGSAGLTCECANPTAQSLCPGACEPGDGPNRLLCADGG